MTRPALLAWFAILGVATSAGAGEPPTGLQAAPAATVSCDAQLVRARQGWSDAAHSDLANDFHKERIEIPDKWCRLWEAKGSKKEFAAGDFARVLFTGPGLHPSFAGSLVPGSGPAIGGSFHTEQHPDRLRIVETVNAMRSMNGSSSVAARIFAMGSPNDPTQVMSALDVRRTGSMFIARQSLTELTYFGSGNDSAEANRSTFALRRTLAGGALDVPVRYGLIVSAQLSALSIVPSDLRGPAFSPTLPTGAGTPAPLAGEARYAIYGGGVRLSYPRFFRTRGYSTEAGVVVRRYQGLTDASVSYGRADMGWTNSYTVGPTFGAIRVGALATLSMVPDGDAVPVALQPTLGGTDIDGTQVLRSFRDYRFRAPNRLAISVEHQRTIKGPLSSLVFADWGGVATRLSDFDMPHFHRSVGVGVSLHLGGVTVVRAFYAFGGGEGTRTTFTGASDNFAEPFIRQSIF